MNKTNNITSPLTSGYILIQWCKAKMPLLSICAQGSPYTIQFRDIQITLDSYLEAWLGTNIFTDRATNKNFVAQQFRMKVPDIASDEIDGLIKDFVNKHPLTPVEYNFKDIPVIATDDSYCELKISIFKYPVKLTREQESALLNIIASQEIHDKELKMRIWFENYCRKYNIEARLKRDRVTQIDELIWDFMYIHGLYRFPIKRKVKEQSLTRNERLKVYIGIVFFAIVYIFITGGLLALASKIDDVFVSSAFAVLGLLLLSFGLKKIIGYKW